MVMWWEDTTPWYDNIEECFRCDKCMEKEENYLLRKALMEVCSILKDNK